jgi:hypothetical protein
MSFFIALLLTILVCMYAEKNFPGAITDLCVGVVKILMFLFILVMIMFIWAIIV